VVANFCFPQWQLEVNFHNEGPISLITALRLTLACSKDVPNFQLSLTKLSQETFIEFR